MYKYDAIDRQLINERVDQFRDQVRRWKAGELADDEFRPLRLQNGLYIQRHAPMFRIAVPYGMMSSAQLRKLGHVARKYDRGYGHFTTRHNLQLNWPKVEDVPEILAELAEVEMHAIQTSGNCMRNITTDQFAGVAADEVIDPRPLAEILRQWTTFHPEFAFLPRKFKIAISGTKEDRAVTWFHDIGLHLQEQNGEVGFRVIVGGGLGRTPIRGQIVREFLPCLPIRRRGSRRTIARISSPPRWRSISRTPTSSVSLPTTCGDWALPCCRPVSIVRRPISVSSGRMTGWQCAMPLGR